MSRKKTETRDRHNYAYRIDGSIDYEREVKESDYAKGRNPDTHRPTGRLWSKNVDSSLFDSDTPITRHSPEYYEFQLFYERFLKHQQQRDIKKVIESSSSDDKKEELDRVKKVLELYNQFRDQKCKVAAESIRKAQNALPISQYEDIIIKTVQSSRVTIIAADTGAGKSTQVPQYMLKAGFSKIACTQPRRIACISLAMRVAHEAGNLYGGQIGYQIRFEGTKGKHTKILFLTEGVLLRQFSGDRMLSMYDVIIVDEVHERHILSDFSLGILKRLLNERPDLKIVLMSATINAELFSSYFGNAPLIQVPGRLYPVEIEHISLMEDQQLLDERLFKERKALPYRVSIASKQQFLDVKPFLQILKRIDDQYPANERGDALIFVSGLNEITTLSDELKIYAQQTRRWIILKLHSTLSYKEQDKVFRLAPNGVRKCIIATNIAETSITIDGIRFIIDSGKVKELDYDLKANLSRLSEFWIAKSSAKQRAGRAGRTGPGHCFRLYSEKEYNHLNDFPVPEIHRGPLASLVLQIKALDLGDPLKFDFIERPPVAHLRHALEHLESLGALIWRVEELDYVLSPLGKTLSSLPVDTMLGKMMVQAAAFNLIDPILILAAGLSIQTSPILKLSPDADPEVHKKREALFSPLGDPFTLWRLFHEWVKKKLQKQQNSKQWCRSLGLEEQRFYEMAKLVGQFRQVLRNHIRNICEQEDHRKARDLKSAFGKRSAAFAKLQRFRGQKMEGSNRKKRLRLDEETNPDGGSDDEQNSSAEEDDINELDFDYRNDPYALEQQIENADYEKFSFNELMIIKFILLSGLYPNICTADSSNIHRKISEQIFHSRSKKFVFIHPNSVLASFDLALMSSSGGLNKRSTSNHQPTIDFSGEANIFDEELDDLKEMPVPEFLCYLQLVETNKPYMMNVFKVPALACFLSASHIDVSESCTLFVLDDWIIFDLKSFASFGDTSDELKLKKDNVRKAGLNLLKVVAEIRFVWSDIISSMLFTSARTTQFTEVPRQVIDKNHLDKLDPFIKDIYDLYLTSRDKIIARDVFQESVDRQKLNDLLVLFNSMESQFAAMGIAYSVDTLRSNDLAVLFPHADLKNEQQTIQRKHGQRKNGIQVTPFLNFGSVSDRAENQSTSLQIGESKRKRSVWQCFKCRISGMFTEEEKDSHMKIDCLKMNTPSPEINEDGASFANNVAVVSEAMYICPTCNETFPLKPIAVLRHKSQCTPLAE